MGLGRPAEGVVAAVTPVFQLIWLQLIALRPRALDWPSGLPQWRADNSAVYCVGVSSGLQIFDPHNMERRNSHDLIVNAFACSARHANVNDGSRDHDEVAVRHIVTFAVG
jgi:hypothetical protein